MGLESQTSSAAHWMTKTAAWSLMSGWHFVNATDTAAKSYQRTCTWPSACGVAKLSQKGDIKIQSTLAAAHFVPLGLISLTTLVSVFITAQM